ncbi:dTDP-4-dehydrorhamnose reductase [Aquicella siphonis]|nr:dTDP-4-dehydrorhamnose reductase [Aquicella siphonis]
MQNYSLKILVTGGAGQLANALRAYQHTRFHLVAATRSDLDITQEASIQKAISRHKPDLIVNAAAYTAVDKAEQEQDAAMRVNHLGAQNIAAACRKNRIPLIHLSTDYLFDGHSKTPYREEDTCHPLNIYGKSKWLGEQAVREQCEEHVILRVSAVFSEFGHNFLKTMLRLAAERDELRVIADQVTCPTYAGHIAKVIYDLADKSSPWGTYHYCDTAPVSWHQFASVIIQEANRHKKLRVTKIHPVPAAEYHTPAMRPAFSVLDCHKIASDYQITQAAWMDAVKKIVPSLLSGQDKTNT